MNTLNTSTKDNSKKLELVHTKHGAKCNIQRLKIDGTLIPVRMIDGPYPAPGDTIKITMDDLRRKWRMYK